MVVKTKPLSKREPDVASRQSRKNFRGVILHLGIRELQKYANFGGFPFAWTPWIKKRKPKYLKIFFWIFKLYLQ